VRRSIQEKERRLCAAIHARQQAVNEALRLLYAATQKINKVKARLDRLRKDFAFGGKYYDELLLGSRRLADASSRRKKTKARA
jgi:hypothetical protein